MTYLINDPVNRDEIKKRKQNIDKVTSYVGLSRDDLILECMREKTVLDIGFAEHNLNLAENENWFHRKIVAISKECIGADLNRDLVCHFNSKGYNSIVVDVCSEEYIGRKFDVIHAGDIIEHLHNIEGFFKFIMRHLCENGVVVITTPSPFSRHTLGQFIRYGIDVPNLEHAAWITSFNMMELCRRFGMVLEQRIFPTKRSSGNNSIFYSMCTIFPFLKKYYEFSSGENIFVLKRRDALY